MFKRALNFNVSISHFGMPGNELIFVKASTANEMAGFFLVTLPKFDHTMEEKDKLKDTAGSAGLKRKEGPNISYIMNGDFTCT